MEVDQDLIETSIQAPIGSAMLEPDSRIIQRPGWYQLVTPSIREASANEIVLSRIPDQECQPVSQEAEYQVAGVARSGREERGPRRSDSRPLGHHNCQEQRRSTRPELALVPHSKRPPSAVQISGVRDERRT